MRIGIISEIIQKVDIGRGDNGEYLGITQSQINDVLCVPLHRSDYLKEFLKLFGKKSLSEVSNIPVRMLGVVEIREDDSLSDEIEIMAIGDYLEDKWLPLANKDEVYIVDFETLIEEWGLQDVTPILFF